ncbi:MAG: hypothetical protein HZA03_07140 [Nitrospinae bacterium]|nr:hypothetical protein [Nitrospinota bacterium]
MVRWVFPAFALLLLMPLSAAAAANCRHEQSHAANHAARAEPVESVPAAGAAPCPNHPGQPRTIKASMMPKCNMEGCCIKADGPLSTGLSNRLSTNDDNALGISAGQPRAGGRLVNAAPHRLHPQRNPPEPDPRPPARHALFKYVHVFGKAAPDAPALAEPGGGGKVTNTISRRIYGQT